MLKPARIGPGSTIGIVSPAGPIPPADFENGISRIQQRGYHIVVAPHVLDRHPDYDYLAGIDEDRAADINSMFADKEIHAVFCARGGYGTIRVLSRLDWDLIKANPKIFVGYSDITSLHLGIARKAGFGTFYGPMIGAHAGLSEQAAEQFWGLLESCYPQGAYAPEASSMATTLVPGVASGELAGGCLCLMAHNCGTPYAPDFDGRIVVIEDIGDPVYRADRNLWQLRNSGCFDRVAGFVVGNLTNWEKQETDPPRNHPDRLFREFFGSLGKPAISGFRFGHERDPFTIPLGVWAELDADKKTLVLHNAAVS